MKVISEAQHKVWLRVSKMDWLTVDEAAVFCRVARTTFERMIRLHKIECYRPGGPGGNRLFRRTDLEKTLLSTRETI